MARHAWFWADTADGTPWTGYLLDFGFKLLKATVGFASSVLLFRFYMWLWPRRLPLVKLGLVGAAASLVAGAAGALVISQFPWEEPGYRAFLRLFYNWTVALSAWTAVYFTYLYRRDLEVETERSLRATALATQARLNMLRYQVNPHFLFNSLNSVRALIRENPEAGCEMVTKLAEFFRYSLLDVHGPNTSFADELKAVQDYLAIQKVRFEERLEVTFDIDPDAESVKLPGFIVQPLVENAIKYGFQTSGVPLRVSLRAKREGPMLRIDVINTGHWISESAGAQDPLATLTDGTGTGLCNVRERLREAFPDRHVFTTADDANGHVRASIVVEVGP
ncbi:histidine kinase [Pendulispora rubella]|uniref:Histidine kinase n=1 Tax=Pendulispora rubella TaxID=2741070 RepID=A0ABZ2LAC9_9BACT